MVVGDQTKDFLVNLLNVLILNRTFCIQDIRLIFVLQRCSFESHRQHSKEKSRIGDYQLSKWMKNQKTAF